MSQAEEGAKEESGKERVDRELGELLEEVRVAIPGAEVLFAFLLGVAFTERFKGVGDVERAVYFGTLLAAAAATALLIAPTAYHRLRFRDGDKEHLLFLATKLVVAALVVLMLAVAGAVYLVGALIYVPRTAGVAGGLTAAWFAWFWFGLPLLRRAKEQSTGSAGQS